MNKYSLLIILLTLSIGRVMACDCSPLPLEKELADVDQVFHGRVIYVNTRSYPISYEFEILESWKGKRKNKVTITSGMGSGDCGLAFKNGQEYLVFSKRGKTSTCRRTAAIDQTKDLALLNWKFKRKYRKQLQKSKPGPLQSVEAEYIANLVMVPVDSLLGKTIAIFDANFLIGKKEFFSNWGGYDVDLRYLVLDLDEKQLYGIDGMLVAWADGAIVENERKYLLEHSRSISPDNMPQSALTQKQP